MSLFALSPRHQLLQLREISSRHFLCPPLAPPRQCPTRLLTTASHPHRSTLGRIHPIPTSSSSSHHNHNTNPVSRLPDLFDLPASDPTPHTAAQRVLLAVRRSGRIVFAVCTAVAGVAALGTVGYELLLDPAHAAHVQSFDFVRHHPAAVALLGGGRLVDLSDPMRGQLCSDVVRQAGDEQWAECRYRVRGDGAQAGQGEVRAVLKRGKRGGWLVVYATVDAVRADGRRERVVVCDYRNQVLGGQQASLAAP